MQLDRKPCAFRDCEHAGDLVGRERNPLAKPIDGVNQTFVRQRWDHRVRDISDIGVTFVGKFGRQRMRAEERCSDRDITLFGEPACGAEQLTLGVKVEPIAGFDFDRANALGDKSVQSHERRSDELLFARGASRPHGGKYAAAFAGDLFIRCAGEPQLEFVRSIASVNEVGMAIDQSGCNPATLAVDDAGAVAPCRRNLGLRAYESDASFARGDCARLADSKPLQRRRERRQTGVEPNRIERVGSVCLNHGAQRLPAADHFMLRPNCPKGKAAASAADRDKRRRPVPVLHAARALTPEGWKSDVRVTIDGGAIATVETEASAQEGDERHAIMAPAPANLHSHAFQRAMAGLAEVRGQGDDTFWTWRETMYRFALMMSPDDVEAVAAQLYVEMLEAGFAAVAEFHYLHNAPDGSPYAEP